MTQTSPPQTKSSIVLVQCDGHAHASWTLLWQAAMHALSFQPSEAKGYARPKPGHAR